MKPKAFQPFLAVIGCGHWGRHLTRNMAELGALSCVCDLDATSAKNMGERHGVSARSLDEILADTSVEAVMLATPAESHAALVEACLNASKHVFVEKPLALKQKDGAPLVELARSKGKTLMVGHLLQFHPAFNALKDILASGRLGRINYIYSNRLNFGKIRTEENALWSFAPHDISMILALYGQEPETVKAIGHNYLHRSIADVTTTHLTFPSGQAAHIHVSWLHPFKEQRLVVVGDQGMAIFDDQLEWERKVQIFAHSVAWVNGRPEPDKADAEPVALVPKEPLRRECEHFIDCVKNGTPPLTDGNEALGVLKVLEAAQQSIESGKTVRFNGIDDPSIHESAVVDEGCAIGEGTKIWHFSHVLSGSHIGQNCSVGQNVSIGPNVTIGKGCKIQNNVSIYNGVTLEDDVFCGPSMVFTNVLNPRAHINRKSEFKQTLVRQGATIGANATVVCGNSIGRYAFVGASAVVTKNVPDFALVVGNPAKIIGHVCLCGEQLPKGHWTEASCKKCGQEFEKNGAGVSERSAN